MLAKLKRSLFLKSRKHNQREYIVLPDLDMKKLSSQNLEIINRPTICLLFLSENLPSTPTTKKNDIGEIDKNTEYQWHNKVLLIYYSIAKPDPATVKVRKLISTKFHNTKYSASKLISQII